ncbi:Stromal cell-derived factor 2-like protein 1 [Rhizophlyctis rosea]|uniref:Stromal cell-derived factor 2-like protein 1 n=1 Tax=Rhizophlyctis rosea TaxID=64517 RepID=A0AAD5SAD9_9FUNG|nr:Stromal cell-derived factor 2-like protein 1 [Rhizophlyctis rosea]
MHYTALLALLATLTVAVTADQQSFVIEEEFAKVSYSSAVKLTHKQVNFTVLKPVVVEFCLLPMQAITQRAIQPKLNLKLHFNSVNYGSGSGQQSVTGFPRGDDPSSYWTIHHGFGETPRRRGDSVPCNAIITLTHLNTDTRLHSHDNHASPISHKQEVSAYAGTDFGDNWQVVCPDKKSGFWLRENPIRLQHIQTKKYLSSSGDRQFGRPIQGQLEISGANSAGAGELWVATEGIYYASNETKE